MEDGSEELSEGVIIAGLARRLFGPEEDWDDAECDFVLRLHGIDTDPESERLYAKKLLENVIERFRKKKKPVPAELLQLLRNFCE
jgi:hypothetical protein